MLPLYCQVHAGLAMRLKWEFSLCECRKSSSLILITPIRSATQPRVMGEVRLQRVSVDAGDNKDDFMSESIHNKRQPGRVEQQQLCSNDDFMADANAQRRPQPTRAEPSEPTRSRAEQPERVQSRYDMGRQDSGRGQRRDSTPKNRFDMDRDEGHAYVHLLCCLWYCPMALYH